MAGNDNDAARRGLWGRLAFFIGAGVLLAAAVIGVVGMLAHLTPSRNEDDTARAAVAAPTKTPAESATASATPQSIVAAHLKQIAAGDFAAALRGTSVPAYAAAAKPVELITDPRIVSLKTVGATATAAVSYRLGAASYSGTVALTRDPGTGWHVTTPLVGTVTVSVTQPPEVGADATYVIGGADASGDFHPAAGDSNEYSYGHLTLLPGRYTLSATARGGLMTADDATVTVGSTTKIAGAQFSWRLTPQASQAVSASLAKTLAKLCVTPGATPTACPLDALVPGAQAGKTVRWSVSAAPTAAANRDGSFTTADGPGRAHWVSTATGSSGEVSFAVTGVYVVSPAGTVGLEDLTATR